MSSETVISLTTESLYTILAGIAGIAAVPTGWIMWRMSKMTERINNTAKTLEGLDKRIVFIEQLKMQESQQIVQSFIVELKNNLGKAREGESSNK